MVKIDDCNDKKADLQNDCLNTEENKSEYSLQFGKANVHVRYAKTNRTLVDNLNQYFSGL